MKRPLILVVTAALVAACGVEPVAEDPTADDWAAEAVAWREAGYEAGRLGYVNALRFWDENVVFEDRIGGEVIKGRESFYQYALDRVGAADPSVAMSYFLSADEALDQYRWSPFMEVAWLDRVQIGEQGARLILNGASIESFRFFHQHEADHPDLATVEALAHRFVSVWDGEDGGASSDLYSQDARIDDTLRGLSVSGLEAISDSVGANEWPDLSRVEIVQLDRGPAIYLSPALSEHDLDEVRLIVKVDYETGCAGEMGVALAWDGERVQWERRYHEVESARRCLDPTKLQPGWWEGIQVPEPILVERTGTMVWEEQDLAVEIYNGIPASQAFVRWGLERFLEAGLSPPSIASVTFLPTGSSLCGGFTGYYMPDESGAEISLCSPPEVMCKNADCTAWSTNSRATLLHEYSHAWIDENLDEKAQATFLELVGLPRWRDHEDPPEERGVERAANTIMLGLIDDVGGLAIARDIPCEERSAGFRQLTGMAPITRCHG
jgi:hypothetical protein